MAEYSWKRAWQDAKSDKKSDSETAQASEQSNSEKKYTFKQALSDVKNVGSESESKAEDSINFTHSDRKLTQRNPYAQQIVSAEANAVRDAQEEASEDYAIKNRDAIAKLLGEKSYDTATKDTQDWTRAVNLSIGGEKMTDSEVSELKDSGVSDARLNASKATANILGRLFSGIGNFAKDTATSVGSALSQEEKTRAAKSGIMNDSQSEDIKAVSDYSENGGDTSDFDSTRTAIFNQTGKLITRAAYDKYKNSESKNTYRKMVSYNTQIGNGTAQKINSFAGGVAESVGNMVIPMLVGDIAGSSAEGGGIISTVVNQIKGGSTVGQALKAGAKAAFQYNTTTALMAANAAENKYVEAAKEYGDRPFAVTVNAIGTGLIEYVSENLNDINDIASLGRYLTVDPSGSVLRNIVKSIPNLLIGGAEEAGEEIFASPLESMLDKATGEHDKKWFGYGNGAVFDAKELIESGLSGFSVGILFGSVATLANSVANAKNIKAQAEVVNEYISRLPEQIRPNPLDVNTATEAQVKKTVNGMYDLLVTLATYGKGQFVATSDGSIGFSGTYSNPALKLILDDINGVTGSNVYDSSFTENWSTVESDTNTESEAETHTSGADMATGNADGIKLLSPEALREQKASQAQAEVSTQVQSNEQQVQDSEQESTAVQPQVSESGQVSPTAQEQNAPAQTVAEEQTTASAQAEAPAKTAEAEQTAVQPAEESATAAGTPGLAEGLSVDELVGKAYSIGFKGLQAADMFESFIKSGYITDTNLFSKENALTLIDAWQRGYNRFTSAQKPTQVAETQTQPQAQKPAEPTTQKPSAAETPNQAMETPNQAAGRPTQKPAQEAPKPVQQETVSEAPAPAESKPAESKQTEANEGEPKAVESAESESQAEKKEPEKEPKTDSKPSETAAKPQREDSSPANGQEAIGSHGLYNTADKNGFTCLGARKGVSRSTLLQGAYLAGKYHGLTGKPLLTWLAANDFIADANHFSDERVEQAAKAGAADSQSATDIERKVLQLYKKQETVSLYAAGLAGDIRSAAFIMKDVLSMTGNESETEKYENGISAWKHGYLKYCNLWKKDATSADSEAGGAEKALRTALWYMLFADKNLSKQLFSALSLSSRDASTAHLEPLKKESLYAPMRKAFGGTMAEGHYSSKDMYDALEFAVNITIGSRNGNILKDLQDAELLRRAIGAVSNVMSIIPTQTNRTEEQERFQQFSTPPSIGIFATALACIRATDTVLEPSAGVGGLAALARLFTNEIYVNELDPRRRNLLPFMFRDHVFGEDALHIQDVPALKGVKPDVVLMNPPFSNQVTTGTKSTTNSFAHVEAALKKLKDGGRLVAILGAGRFAAEHDSKQYTAWINGLKSNYCVVADVRIDGKEYRKYGTTFDVRVLVIDKVGGQGNVKTYVSECKTVMEAVNTQLLELIADTDKARRSQKVEERGTENPAATASASPISASKPVAEKPTASKPESKPTVEKPASAKQAGSGTGAKPVAEKPAEKSSPTGGKPSESKPSATVSAESKPVAQAASEKPTVKENPSIGVERKNNKSSENSEDDNSGISVFEEYQPPELPSTIPTVNLKKHPAKLVESAAMASVQPPVAYVVPNLPANGAWSREQMVNIVYAKQSFEIILPNGERRGYMIGDGTGVGKGREISGIIMDAFRSGACTKALWISVSEVLFEDAKRDLTDCGWFDEKLGDLVHFDTAHPERLPERGIAFTEYSKIARKKTVTEDAISRSVFNNAEALINWLGKDWQGVLAFDEAHSISNTGGSSSGWGSKDKNGSDQAKAGKLLQEQLPLARVLYVSGTAAKSVDTIKYASRLGLWGEGTAFENSADFAAQIGAGGTAAMELVVRDMKAMGVYNARSISYDGVTFRRMNYNLNKLEIKNLDIAAQAWRIVLDNMNEIAKITNTPVKNITGTFYSATIRFWKSYYASLSAFAILPELRENLKNHISSVVQISLTGESTQKKALAQGRSEGLSDDEIDFSAKQQIISYVQTAFPVKMYENVLNDDGSTTTKLLTDSNGDPVISQEAVKKREELIAELSSMPFPNSPLDIILDEFGAEVVAEISGRKSRRELVDGKYVMRTFKGDAGKRKIAEADAFNNGKKRIVVVTNAGSTGISLHASAKFKNQEQRVMYNVDPSFDVNVFVQAQGRVHRSGQVKTPEFVLVSTNVPGQSRFISAVSSKMKEMGAATKGERDATMDMFGRMDSMDSPEATAAFVQYFDDLKAAGKFVELEEKTKSRLVDPKTGKYKFEPEKMLNRMQLLPFDEQVEMYNSLQERLRGIYEAIDAGEVDSFDVGMKTVKAEKADVLKQMLIRTGSNGEKTYFVKLKLWQKPVYKTLETILEKRKGGKFLGIFQTPTGKYRALFDYGFVTGEGGRLERRLFAESLTSFEKLDMPLKLDPVAVTKYCKEGSGLYFRTKNGERRSTSFEVSDIQEMKEVWEKAISELPLLVPKTRNIITGALLPAWDLLGSGQSKIVAERVITPDVSYLGYIVPESKLATVLGNFGVTESFTPEQVYDSVLKGGKEYTIKSTNGTGFELRIYSLITGGERRIAVEDRRTRDEYLMTLVDEKTGDSGLLFREKIGIYAYKTFIVTDKERAIKAFDAIAEVTGGQYTAKGASGYQSPINSDNDEMYSIGHDKSSESGKPASGEKESKISAQDIIDEIQQAFDVQITLGYMRGHSKETTGFYREATKGIRYRTGNDILTVAHELGHALDDRYSITAKASEGELKAFADMLPANLLKAYKKVYAGRENISLLLAQEGLAVSMENYFSNPSADDARAKLFEDMFISKLTVDSQDKLLRIAQKAYTAITDKEALMRGSVHRRSSDGGFIGDVKTFAKGESGWTASETKDFRKGVVRNGVESFIRNAFDANHYLLTLAQESGHNASAYILASNSVSIEGGVYSALLGDVRTLDGDVLGDGLHTVLDELTDDSGKVNELMYDEFGVYLILKHVGERKAQGQVVPDVFENDKFVAEQLDLYDAKYPAFARAAEKFYDYNNTLLEYARMYGLVSADTIKKWNDMYPHHVTMTRYFGSHANEILGKVRRGARGYANQSSPYKRTHGGSKLDYWNGLDVAMEETARVIRAAYMNHVMQEIVDLVKAFPDSASIMENIPLNINVESVGTTKIKDMLTDLLVSANGKNAMEAAGIIDSILPDRIFEYNQYAASNDEKRIVTVMYGGKKQMWKVNDESLYKILVNLSNMGKESAPVKMLHAFTRVMTNFLTAKNPFFTLSNAMRDLGTATFKIASAGVGTGGNRAKVLKAFAKNLLDAYAQAGKAHKGGVNNASEYYREYISLKGADASLYTKGDRTAKEVVKEYNNLSTRRMKPRTAKEAFGKVGKAFTFFSFIGNAVEQSPRYALYVTARGLGYAPQTALRMSEQFTNDFHQGGVISKQINKAVPFFNAAMQGLYENVRHNSGFAYATDDTVQPPTDKARKSRAINRIAILLSLSAAIALIEVLLNLYREDDYNRLSNYVKNNYYCIPTANGKFITVPKPREWAVSETLFERAFESLLTDNDNALDQDDTWEYVTDMLLPSGIASLAQGDVGGMLGTFGVFGTLYEVGANKDFLGRPIVSSAYENLSAKNQYNGGTSVLAWALGQATDISPLKIDHIGENLLGGAWSFVEAMFPMSSSERDWSMGLANKYLKDSAYSQDIVNRMYELKDEAETAKADDPEDADAAIDYKWYNTVSSFYSKYYTLSKSENESAQKRATRLKVLDIIEGTLDVKSGSLYAGQEQLEAYVKRSGNTSVMPAVMASTIAYGKGLSESLSLTADQYVTYQTAYNGYYWDNVEQIVSSSLDDDQLGVALGVARDDALVSAKNDMLKSAGKDASETTSYSAAKACGVSIADYAKVKEYKNSGNAKDSVVRYINTLNITDRKKTALYTSMGYSESGLKDTPWFN